MCGICGQHFGHPGIASGQQLMQPELLGNGLHAFCSTALAVAGVMGQDPSRPQTLRWGNCLDALCDRNSPKKPRACATNVRYLSLCVDNVTWPKPGP